MKLSNHGGIRWRKWKPWKHMILHLHDQTKQLSLPLQYFYANSSSYCCYQFNSLWF